MEASRPTPNLVNARHSYSRHASRFVPARVREKSAIHSVLHPPNSLILILFSEISFPPSASIPIGKLVSINQEYGPTGRGTSRVGPPLAVARMVLPSHLVEGGTKGKALTLLHAWKDRLWVMGGEEKPPRPRLLNASPDEEDDSEGPASDGVEVAARIPSGNSSKGGTLKKLSPEGAYSELYE